MPRDEAYQQREVRVVQHRKAGLPPNVSGISRHDLPLAANRVCCILQLDVRRRDLSAFARGFFAAGLRDVRAPTAAGVFDVQPLRLDWFTTLMRGVFARVFARTTISTRRPRKPRKR